MPGVRMAHVLGVDRREHMVRGEDAAHCISQDAARCISRDAVYLWKLHQTSPEPGLMIVEAALYVLLIMSKVKVESHTSRLSVEEGEAVTLRCAFPRSNGSDIQWVTPRGYTSYFNGEKVLKDRRHQLVRSSRTKLIIRVSNVTRADEGVYACLCYSAPLQTRTVRLSVVAAPSPPSLEVVRIPGKGQKEKYLLTCSTSGGRPCPRLSWQIHDHTEVLGHHNVRQETDGRCTAVSTLRVSAVSHTSTVRCVVRHRTLTPGNLTASYSFHTSSIDTEAETTENSRHHPSDTVTWTPSTEELTTPDVPTSGRQREEDTRGLGTSSSPANTHGVGATNASNKTSSSGNTTDAENTEKNWTSGSDGVTAEVVTFSEGNSFLITDFTITRNANDTTKYDVQSVRESHRNLILVLVSLMLCILLVIVHLFLIKLRKAHYSWKKENEASDQTLESTKSKSNNEETSNQSKNATAAAPAENAKHKIPGIQYNNQVSL